MQSKYPVKKYKRVMHDKRNGIKYVLFTNKKLSRRDILNIIRCYKIDYKLKDPEPGDRINIICED